MRRKSITARLVFTFGSSVLVIIALLIGHTTYNLRKQSLQNREEEILAGMKGVAGLVEAKFHNALAITSTLAYAFASVHASDAPAEMDRGTLISILGNALTQAPLQAMFSVWEPGAFDQLDIAYEKSPGHDEKGRLVPYFYRDESTSMLSECPTWIYQESNGLYSRVRQSGQPVVLFGTGGEEGMEGRVVLFGAPVMDKGRFLGIIGGSMGVEHLQTLLGDSFPLGEQAVLSLRLGDALVASTRPPGEDRTVSPDGLGEDAHGWSRKTVGGTLFSPGEAVLVVPVAVSGISLPLRLVLKVPEAVLTAVPSRLVNRQIVMSLVLAVLLLGLIGYQARRITRPIRMLTEAAKEVAAGAADREVAVDTGDELADLAVHFNALNAIRKEREADLLRSKLAWEETFDAIDDAITIHDRQGRVLRANRAAVQLLGAPMGDIVGKECHGLFHDALVPIDGCPFKKVLASRRAEHFEGFEPHLGRYLDIVCFPRFDQAGKVDGVVHVARDITERKSEEEERRSLQMQMVQTQKLAAIGRLSGGIAHDFNNLLTPIVGYSQLMQSQAVHGRVDPEMLSMVHVAARKAAVLVQQLLAFSRKQVLEMRVVDLNELVQEMLRILRRTIGEHITLTEELSGKPLPILADAGQVGQVVMNLALNAGDAMQDGGGLLVRCEQVGPEPLRGTEVASFGEARLIVRDTGCGMSPAIREKIFEPFFTTKVKGEGTGLGLSTVFGIVKQHRGRIEVDSEPGRGSEFRILFPLVKEDCSEVEGEFAEELQGGGETILVVDDNSLVLRFAHDLLESLGYRLLSAVSGEDAIEQFCNYPETIHLLLVDVVLPGMNGRDLAAALTERMPSLKVVYMSGYTDDILDRHGVLGEELALLHKPLRRQEVACKLRQLLDG